MKRKGSGLVKQESLDFHCLVSADRERTLSSWGMTVTGMCFQDWNENMPDKLGRMDEEIAYELLVYSLTFL